MLVGFMFWQFSFYLIPEGEANSLDLTICPNGPKTDLALSMKGKTQPHHIRLPPPVSALSAFIPNGLPKNPSLAERNAL